ncbi:MAG: type II toxin-antitoxin system MqsR family toxin [Desulfobacterales bacterium]|uniref:Type II toxin-antitoxin system MqsR family toxin n=1 Tax=Candidatus Desulfatibia profunda TaxID=2841695 RepID=A0A8J6NNM2_9BACT|nr:type II toxin-antitoxin system MqsR family toxin [Candidatus Desulfatibia profunda]MBL7181092.1 type II toxin-antitoxin system MqsR family toxin [Desulfobacterales bacterium]
MAFQNDVNKFLSDFKKLIAQRGVLLLFRKKNQETLTELGFTQLDVQNEILKLDSTDYSDGPQPDDKGRPGEVWVFGKVIKHEEIYIKLKISGTSQPICISFHAAEQPMNYPYG